MAADSFHRADEQLRTTEVQLRKWLVRLEARSSYGRFSIEQYPWERLEKIPTDNCVENR
jgi:hypothetical protein